MKYKPTTVTMLLTILVLLTPISRAKAAVVGVEVGDWAKYSVSAGWDTNLPDSTEPEEFGEILDTLWMKLEVEDISGNTVTVERTVHYKDNTETSDTLSADISTGSEELGLMIVPTDLGSGDSIVFTYVPFIGTSLSIDETVTRNYVGFKRDVNLVEETFSVANLGEVDFEGYWDKATGLLCEVGFTMTAAVLGYYMTVSMTMKMTETNAWQTAPVWMEWWFLAVISAIIIAAVAAVFLLARRRRQVPVEGMLEGVPPSPSEPATEEKPSSSFFDDMNRCSRLGL